MTDFNTIKLLLTKGDTASAMEMLLFQTRDSNQLHKQAIVLAARYEKWNEAKRMGILDKETELNKINVGILELAEQSERTPSTSLSNTLTKKVSYSWKVFLGFLLILILAAWLLKDVLFLKNNNPSVKETQNEMTEKTNLSISKFKNKVFKPELNTWYANIQPFSATCKMTILDITSEAKDANTDYLELKLSVQHTDDTWHPVQLTANLFLLRRDGFTEKTETDLSVVSVEQHESKQIDLKFSVPHGTQALTLLVKNDGGKLTEIPIHSN